MSDDDQVRLFEAIVAALEQPGSWPESPPVEIRRTHCSVVFLVGERVYKLKRPLDLGFLDYSTLERRHRACLDEVRLNTPRAPGVYLGVQPIVRAGAGFRVGGEGEPVEYAVEMVRLPDEACLLHRVEQGQVSVQEMETLGRTLASLHRAAQRGPEISRYARREAVAANALANLDQSEPEVGLTVQPEVHQRLRSLLQGALERLGPLMERRADSGIPCDTHGDLRLDHVYFLPDRSEPVLVDCIEFSDALRFADPVSDLAFLTMDLRVRGERQLADALRRAWLSASGDAEGAALLPFYESYRSAVRAKVAGLLLRDRALPEDDRQAALQRARRHWMLALCLLEEPARRPCLVGIGGLPGTGKTTLAQALAALAGFEIVRSDVVRKQRAGLPLTEHPQGQVKEALYTEEAKDAVYAECMERAAALVLKGRQVIVDASFGRARWRQMLLDQARALAVPCALLRCEASAEVARARLAAREQDASDADDAVYERARWEWEEGPETMLSVRTDAITVEQAANRAWEQVLQTLA